MTSSSHSRQVQIRIRFFRQAIACAFLLVVAPTLWAQDEIQFQRDIRPILSDNCFKCHGPDEADRKADLRLDTQEGLLESESVVPGDVENSLIRQRIFSDDETELMPPPDSGRELTDQQKKLLQLWISQGAKWEGHWSLVPPKKPAVPKVNDPRWEENPIDAFVLARMRSQGLAPNPEAERKTLIRRVCFDLTGLPPTPELLARYDRDNETNWYERLVDELIESPAYGEHMARYWLDAARYGDTHGLHLDNYREMWLYRDWVVKAFNRNLSYRQFTIEQLAGDLLDKPTQDQLIGSGFNRAHITTSEGGAIAEEVYVRNVVDRVATTGTVFMGLTVGCAQCHDHKFDPISQKEFYQLFAYFNNMTDPPLDKNIKDPQPVIRVMDAAQKEKDGQLNEAWEKAKGELEKAIKEFDYEEPVEPEPLESDAPQEADSSPTGETENDGARKEFVWIDGKDYPAGAAPSGAYQLISANKDPAKSDQHSRKQTGKGTIQHLFTGAIIPLVASSGDTLFADVYLDPKNPPEEVMLQFNDGNWEHRVYWGENKIEWGGDKSPSRFYAGPLPEKGKWIRLKIKAEEIGFQDKAKINGMAFTQFGGTAYWSQAGIVSKHDQAKGFDSFQKWVAFARKNNHASTPNPLKKIVKTPEEEWNETQRQKLLRHFLLNINSESREKLSPLTKASDAAKKQLDEFSKTVPTTLVSKESDKIKDAFVLDRGEYDQKGEKVQRMTPKALPPMASDMPNNRLGFAKWLTSGSHPLTARVAVNRFWQQAFGVGLVKTAGDFGAQGEHPSHPLLLDWLAVDFVENDWDVRQLMKSIVLSQTYRQSSVGTHESFQKDPENKYLSRGPRFRLDAEMLRDQALAVSELLNRKMGGPSVKPPQPAGLWLAVGYSGSNTVRFVADKGADKVYRRSLYTFWKRTSPPPQMTTFDAPSREECNVRRERTNTPLQALLLMNEPQYVQAAMRLAASVFEDAELNADQKRIEALFEKALSRPPSDRELKILVADFEKHVAELAEDYEQVKQLLGSGEAKVELGDEQKVKVAAMTMVANLVMNLDEFLTKN